MYYVIKRIGTKEYKISEGEIISLPITLALPCDLIKMSIDEETKKEKYEVVLRKRINSNEDFSNEIPIYDAKDKCINSEIVTRIYDNEDYAREVCHESNMRKLIVKALGSREHFNDIKHDYENLINSFYEKMDEKVLYRKK